MGRCCKLLTGVLGMYRLPERAPEPVPVPVPAPAFNYASQKVRGVNLGGWLVLERTFFLLHCIVFSR